MVLKPYVTIKADKTPKVRTGIIEQWTIWFFFGSLGSLSDLLNSCSNL